MSAAEHRTTIFVDMRGSSVSAQSYRNFGDFPELLMGFYGMFFDSLDAVGLKADLLKVAGDGAIAWCETDSNPDLLLRIFTFYTMLVSGFNQLQLTHNADQGTTFFLPLGVGVSRGRVERLSEETPGWSDKLNAFIPFGAYDYFGPSVNTAAKLCGRARPLGLIIDAQAFGETAFKLPPSLVKRSLKLESETLPVYATSEVEVTEQSRALPGLPGGDPRRPEFFIELEQSSPRYFVKSTNPPFCRVGVRSTSEFQIRIARLEITAMDPTPENFATHVGLPLTLSPAYPSQPNYTEIGRGGEVLFNVLSYGHTADEQWIELLHNVPEVPKRLPTSANMRHAFVLRAIAERPGSFIMNEPREAVLIIESGESTPVSRIYLKPEK